LTLLRVHGKLLSAIIDRGQKRYLVQTLALKELLLDVALGLLLGLLAALFLEL